MSGITLREYLPCDVFEVQRRNGDFLSDRFADIGEASVFASTFVDGHRPVGCVGGQMQWAGVAQIWAVLSDGLRGHGLLVTRACRKLLDEQCARHGVRRVHCLVRSDNGEYLRWIRLLDFEHEFTMHSAAPDGADLYGMTRWSDEWIAGHNHRRRGARASTGASAGASTGASHDSRAGARGRALGRVSAGEDVGSRAA